MTRSIDGIRMWINGYEPERGRTLEHANEEVRTLLSALDAEKARADAAEARLAAFYTTSVDMLGDAMTRAVGSCEKLLASLAPEKETP